MKRFTDRKVSPGRYAMVVTADHGGHHEYDGRILYGSDLFNTIKGWSAQDVIQNDPNDGAPFDDMIYLDAERLGDQAIAYVADLVEGQFGDDVYRVYTRDEIFQWPSPKRIDYLNW